MDQQELKTTIENILASSQTGTMATVQDNRPHSRYMTFTHDGLNLYTATDKDTHKVDELEKNPYTHILLGYEGEGIGDEYVEYEGKVHISDDEELKKELWNPDMQQWFDGPEDPDFLVLEIKPEQISLMNKKDLDPRTLEM